MTTNFEEAINYLFNQIPNYHKYGSKAINHGLRNIEKLLDYLGNPHQNFKSIHIAGTNGKGSVSHMLSSVYQEAEFKVGLYTSPHLLDFRERIKINGQMVEKEFVCNFVASHKEKIEELEASFFEITVAMAFKHFSDSKVDIAIIETGLGGRLDATNIIIPELSIITNVGLDHMDLLGNSIEEIATEKAGIIKANTKALLGQRNNSYNHVFEKIASDKNAELFSPRATREYNSDLKGNFQTKNKATVLEAVNLLRKKFPIQEEAIIEGLKKVISNTGLRGRWEQIGENPKIICDTGHNSHAWKELKTEFEKENERNIHMILGFLNNKDVDEIVKYFPKKANYYFCEPKNSRALKIDELKSKLSDYPFKAFFNAEIEECYKKAKNNASTKDLIFIGGSNFTVSDLLFFLAENFAKQK